MQHHEWHLWFLQHLKLKQIDTSALLQPLCSLLCNIMTVPEEDICAAHRVRCGDCLGSREAFGCDDGHRRSSSSWRSSHQGAPILAAFHEVYLHDFMHLESQVWKGIHAALRCSISLQIVATALCHTDSYTLDGHGDSHPPAQRPRFVARAAFYEAARTPLRAE